LIETFLGIFGFVDIGKYDPVVDGDFEFPIKLWLLRDELAIFLDFILEGIQVIAGLLERVFSGFGFIPYGQDEMLRIRLHNLIERPVLDLENDKTRVIGK